MTSTRPRHLWLLVLTFAVGQWLAVLHGVQHEINSGAQLVACEVCTVGHAMAGPPAMRLLPPLPLAAVERPAAITAAPAARPSLRVPPSRGPPLFLG